MPEPQSAQKLPAHEDELTALLREEGNELVFIEHDYNRGMWYISLEGRKFYLHSKSVDDILKKEAGKVAK
jgi:hypothetical protein